MRRRQQQYLPERSRGPRRRGIWKGRLGTVAEFGRSWDSAAGLAQERREGRTYSHQLIIRARTQSSQHKGLSSEGQEEGERKGLCE